MIAKDLREPIKECTKLIDAIRKKDKLMRDDEYVLNVLSPLAEMIRIDIHKNLIYEKDETSEKQIRKYVKTIMTTVFPVLDEKMDELKRKGRRLVKRQMTKEDWEKKKTFDELAERYVSVYDDYWALVSFRSLEHFAQYMEFDKDEKEKIWKYNLNCFHGFWYYANQMVLDGSWRYLEKQCPTGYGKSYCDIVLMAFIFGQEPSADILKVVGNPQLVGDFTTKLVRYMCMKRYAKVFPHYEQFECDRTRMFEVCQLGGGQQPGKLLISGSEKGTSLLIINKDTPCDGGRFKYRFYDDVTRSADKVNIAAHEKDKARYNDQWKKRKYDDEQNFEVFSGTTYHIEDFLSYIKRKYGGEMAIKSSVNLYTKVNKETRAVFVSVPKLDPQTDECTFPHKYSTAEARLDREADYATFMAMDQQEPVPLEGCPFAYSNLYTYAAIPHVEEREDECCWAALDPARTGKNYVSMPIFLKIDDKHYLKDCIFEMVTMQVAVPRVVEKVIRHHITKLHVENNTDTSLKTLLMEKFRECGVDFCEITEVYSYKKKEDKIFNAETSIRLNMVFPEFGVFSPVSQMGNFMKFFTSYSYKVKNEYDDAPDSVAIYSDKFVSMRLKPARVQVLNMRRRR